MEQFTRRLLWAGLACISVGLVIVSTAKCAQAPDHIERALSKGVAIGASADPNTVAAIAVLVILTALVAIARAAYKGARALLR